MIINMDDIIINLMDEYGEKFGEGFPSFQLLRGRTPEEGAALIRHCLDAGKNAYDLGLVTLDDNVFY